MEQLNKIELRGVIGSVRTQSSGETKMARLTLVTNYAYKDKDGAAIIDSSWHNVVAWEGKYISDLDKIARGSKVYVIGRLRYNKYSGVDGVERIATEIVANRLSLIDDAEPLQYEM